MEKDIAPEDKLSAVIRVLEHVQSVQEVCREWKISEREFKVWRDQAFSGAVSALKASEFFKDQTL